MFHQIGGLMLIFVERYVRQDGCERLGYGGPVIYAMSRKTVV